MGASIEAVSQYPWFHSIDLGDGVVTPGVKSLSVMCQEADAIFGPVTIEGASLIDIGAWNGGYTVEAHRRGASRVLATDHFVWRHERFRGRETFDLVKQTLGIPVEAVELEIANHTVDRLGSFDVVLFLGVFYHLFDPIHALAKIAALSSEVVIIESHIDMLEEPRPAMVFYPGDECFQDETNWWGPNPQLLQALLPNFGFEVVDCALSPTPGRVIVHAWRSPRLRKRGTAPPVRYEYRPPAKSPQWWSMFSRRR